MNADDRRHADRDGAEDYDDRADREAHGFTYEDTWTAAVLCRNGCGLTYSEVVAGKVRYCSAGRR